MSQPELEPMAEDLVAVIASEKRAGAVPVASKARVHARVLATIGGGGGGGGSSEHAPQRALPSVRPASSLARFAAVFALGAAAGGVAVYALAPPKIVERRVEVTTEPIAVTAPRIERTAAVDPAPSVSVVPTVSATATAPSDSLSTERALLDPARVALGRGDASSALAAVRTHEQRYPRGQLVEEREAIATQALVLAGKKEEARARGQRFLVRYPGSVLVPTVQAAIEAAQ